jgi:hypothetical protein
MSDYTRGARMLRIAVFGAGHVFRVCGPGEHEEAGPQRQKLRPNSTR